jgi:hypothetical protein
MPSPAFSNEEIVALRKTGLAADQRFVDWAIDALVQGQDSPGLRVLAGEAAPFSHFEMQALVDRSFRELGMTASPSIEDALKTLAKRLARLVLAGEADRGTALQDLRRYYLEFEVSVLQDFYLLSHALEDLQSERHQWYWPEADQGNIDKVIDDRFRALVDEDR